MTESPVEFLTRVLVEMEQIAKAALHGGSGEWPYKCDHVNWEGNWEPPGHGYCAKVDNDEITIYDEGGHSPEQARHICVWDPATVLRHIAGARKLMELHALNPMAEDMRAWYLRFHPELLPGWCATCGERPGKDELFEGPLMEVRWPCPTLKIEAERWGWAG